MRRLLVVVGSGFANGLPLALTHQSMQARLSVAGWTSPPSVSAVWWACPPTSGSGGRR